MKLLVTGGCGFIGSNFIRLVLKERPTAKIINLDALTYAGKLDNLRDVQNNPRYVFRHGAIEDSYAVDWCMAQNPNAVVNFAAESHVDRSIVGSLPFIRTNIEGTACLLDAALRYKIKRFLQVSTDEVYGSLPKEGIFLETTPLHPNNPYSATKAAADHLVQAYAHTFGLDTIITRSSNNYGPFQYPEKFIPLFAVNAIKNRPCPLYGDGRQIRDWLHVNDNCRGILAALDRGVHGNVYNLGGGNERTNLVVARAILKHFKRPESLIQFVKDRPGHDRRYAISGTKANVELGWSAQIKFEDGLKKTLDWYKVRYSRENS